MNQETLEETLLLEKVTEEELEAMNKAFTSLDKIVNGLDAEHFAKTKAAYKKFRDRTANVFGGNWKAGLKVLVGLDSPDRILAQAGLVMNMFSSFAKNWANIEKFLEPAIEKARKTQNIDKDMKVIEKSIIGFLGGGKVDSITRLFSTKKVMWPEGLTPQTFASDVTTHLFAGMQTESTLGKPTLLESFKRAELLKETLEDIRKLAQSITTVFVPAEKEVKAAATEAGPPPTAAKEEPNKEAEKAGDKSKESEKVEPDKEAVGGNEDKVNVAKQKLKWNKVLSILKDKGKYNMWIKDLVAAGLDPEKLPELKESIALLEAEDKSEMINQIIDAAEKLSDVLVTLSRRNVGWDQAFSDTRTGLGKFVNRVTLTPGKVSKKDLAQTLKVLSMFSKLADSWDKIVVRWNADLDDVNELINYMDSPELFNLKPEVPSVNDIKKVLPLFKASATDKEIDAEAKAIHERITQVSGKLQDMKKDIIAMLEEDEKKGFLGRAMSLFGGGSFPSEVNPEIVVKDMLNLLLKQSKDVTGVKSTVKKPAAVGPAAVGSKVAVQRAMLESKSNIRKLVKEDLQMLRTAMSGIKNVFAAPPPPSAPDVPAKAKGPALPAAPKEPATKSPFESTPSSPEALSVQQLAFEEKLKDMSNAEVAVFVVKSLLANPVAFKMVFPNPADKGKATPALLIAIKQKLGL